MAEKKLAVKPIHLMENRIDKPAAQSVENDEQFNDIPLWHCVKSIQKNLSDKRTPDSFQYAYQALCFLWNEADKSVLSLAEKEKIKAAVDAFISQSLADENNDETSIKIGQTVLQKHRLPNTFSMCWERVASEQGAQSVLRQATALPQSEPAVLFLGGDGTTDMNRLNGYLGELEKLFHQYFPAKQPRLFGVVYDWGENYETNRARSFLFQENGRNFNNYASDKDQKARQDIFKDYIGWLLKNYIQKDLFIKDFFLARLTQEPIKNFLLMNLNNKNIQKFLSETVPPHLLAHIFPPETGITNRAKLKRYLYQLTDDKINALLPVFEPDEACYYFKKEQAEKTTQLFLNRLWYLEKKQKAAEVSGGFRHVLTKQDGFFVTYLKKETIAAFCLEELTDANLQFIHKKIDLKKQQKAMHEKLCQNLFNLLDDVKSDKENNAVGNKLLEQFFLQHMTSEDMSFFFFKNIDVPSAGRFLNERKENKKSVLKFSFDDVQQIVEKTHKRDVYNFLLQEKRQNYVQIFLKNLLKYKIADKILLLDQERQNEQEAFQPISQKNISSRFPTMNEYCQPQYIQSIFNDFFLPRLVNEEGKRYEPQAINQVCQKIRNITVVAHCHGAHVFMQIEKLMQQKMKELGYTAKERSLIQKQLVCIAQEPYCPVNASQSRLISFTSAQDPIVKYYNYMAEGYTFLSEIKASDASENVSSHMVYFPYSSGRIFVVPSLGLGGLDEHNFYTPCDVERGKIIDGDARDMLELSCQCIFNSVLQAGRGKLLIGEEELWEDLSKNQKETRELKSFSSDLSHKAKVAQEAGRDLYDAILKQAKWVRRFEQLVEDVVQMDLSEAQQLAFPEDYNRIKRILSSLYLIKENRKFLNKKEETQGQKLSAETNADEQKRVLKKMNSFQSGRE